MSSKFLLLLCPIETSVIFILDFKYIYISFGQHIKSSFTDYRNTGI